MFVRLCLALFLLALAPATALASALELFGYGARGLALVGASATTARGHAGVYYNPAALALEKRPSFGIAYQAAAFDLERNGGEVSVRDAPALTLGLCVPVPLKGFLADRLAAGLGFVIPQSSLLIADLPRPGEPSFAVLESRAHTLSLQGAIGFRPTPWLSVGGGVLALATVRGLVDIAPNELGRVGSAVANEVVTDYAPLLGLLVRPFERLSLAVVYHGESRADFDFPVEADLGETFPLPVPALDISGTAQFDPAQLWVEISGRPIDSVLVAAGMSWSRWSRFANPISYTAVPDGFPTQPEPHFDDTTTWRAGVEGRFELLSVEIEPRAGAAWIPTPAPDQEGLHSYLDNDRVQLGAGLGLRRGPLRLDLAAQLHLLFERSQTKDPAPIEAAGFEAPEELTLSHGGHAFLFGLELGVTL